MPCDISASAAIRMAVLGKRILKKKNDYQKAVRPITKIAHPGLVLMNARIAAAKESIRASYRREVR